MITSQYGCEIEPEVAVYDDSGQTVGIIGLRKEDGARRYYALHQLRADQGWREIYDATYKLPTVADDSAEFQEALEK